MARPAIGTSVSVDGLQGVIVGHRPQGMVDIRVDGEDFIARKRASALRILNPQRSSLSARVRREVEQMLHSPPSSWKALYRRAGLPARPSADDFIDIVRSKTPSGRSAEAHYGQEMGEGRHVPPKDVREAALHGLRLSYDNNYTSQSGVGLARAVQLVLDPSIDDLAKTRMRAYLTRHERDKQGKNFGNDRNPSNGYMAWLNWGGDPAKEWLNMRNNPAGRKMDVMKKQDEQFRAVVQGIYESLMSKRLGVKSIYTPTGRRRDLAALRMGTLSQKEVRAIQSRAFAIATTQGQKHGYLIPGTQQPTAKGRRRAYKRHEDAQDLAENAQDYEVTLSLARKSGPLRIVAKGRGKSRRFHVQPLMPGLNPKGYKSEAAAKGAITRLRRNPDSLEEFANAVDGDPNTKTLGEMWDEFDDWLEETPKKRHKYAARENETLIRSVIEQYRRQGQTPLQARKSAAQDFIDHNLEVAPEMVSLPAAEAIVRRLAPEKLRGIQQVTKEQRARESRVKRAQRTGRTVVPRTVGQSDVGGREFVSGQRQGKEEADRRKAGKAKGKIKAGIGRAGDGIGPLSRKGRAAEDTTFTAPPGQDGANYPVVFGKDGNGKPVEIGGNISYTIAKTSGNMTLHFSEGDTYRFLPLGVPSALEDRIYGSKSVEEANEIMDLMGRSPLGIKQMYRDELGRIDIKPVTPQQLQTALNRSSAINFRKLAQGIADNGYTRREREEWNRPVVAFSAVETTEDRLGKTEKFETYVVYGFGGNENAVREKLRRSATEAGYRKLPWVTWKEAKGTYGAPMGTWNTRAAHKVFGKSGKYFIVGPLVGQGLTQKGQREYVKALRTFSKLDPILQKKWMSTLRDNTPPVFYYAKKKEAETVRKRLDKKLGKKRVQISETSGATYAFYIDPLRAGEDGGYGAAVAAADALSATAPSPPFGSVAQSRRNVLEKTKRAGSLRRDRKDDYAVVKDRYNAISAQGMSALNAARNQGDKSEMSRLRGIAKKMARVMKRIKKAGSLTDGEQMSAALESIYSTLDSIEDAL